ncbi:ArnT family glycosyltransferase [Spirulina major]|uniref:ArnT family glycosyltransferase n=1 Tax=Spirulina major TaxID=270636 RepID=UPI000933314D|nr:glycosyltransferase family 39 protein [Spirulina major]
MQTIGKQTCGKTWQPLWLLVMAVLIMGIATNTIALWDQDEAAYLGFAQRMLETGQWWIPEFLWSEVHRKPPLQFWVMAGSLAGLGGTVWAARLPSWVAVGLTGWVLWRWGRGVWGEAIAQRAALILLTSWILPNLGRLALTDALLVLWETVAMLAMVRGVRSPHGSWPLWLWGAMALGVLTKGPPILILVGGSGLFWWFLGTGSDRQGLRQLHPEFGLPLALVPFGVWGWMTWRLDGGALLRWLGDWYVLRRVGGEVVFGQWGPPGYFLGVFAIAFLPWLPWFGAALGPAMRRWRSPTQLPLTAWIVAGWLLYELIPSKLPSYALGAYPAIAILIAQTSLAPPGAQRMKRWFQVGFGGAILFTLGLLGTLMIVPAIAVLPLAIGWMAGAVGVYRLSQSGQGSRAFTLATVNAVVFLLILWGIALPSLEPDRSGSVQIAQAIAAHTAPDTVVLLGDRFDLPSIPAYLHQHHRTYRASTTAQILAQLQGPDPVAIITRDPEQRAAISAIAPNSHTTAITAWFDTFGQPQTYWVMTPAKPAVAATRYDFLADAHPSKLNHARRTSEKNNPP